MLKLLRSIVLDSLQTMFADDDEVSIINIYCDYKDRARQTTAGLLANVVKQQVLQLKKLPSEVKSLYEKNPSSVSVDDYTRLLSSFSKHFRRFFILVDALDEHLANDDEESVLELKLLNEILALQTQTKSGTHFSIFLTSRKIPIIEKKLEEALRIEILATNEDIEAYTRARIGDDSKFRFAREVQRNPSLGDAIVSTVVQKAHGMCVILLQFVHNTFIKFLAGSYSPVFISTDSIAKPAFVGSTLL